MYQIDLTLYKESKQYFQLFDILLKDLNINKEAFLKEIGISPSSYRKARTVEQNIGDKIIEQLCRALGYKKATLSYIEDLEKFINKVYFDMYYKIYKSYYDDLDRVNQLLDENSILFPVLKLLKMFLIANSQVDAGRVIKENKSLFEEIKQYIFFFNEDLCELVDVLSLLFEPTIPEKIMMKSYKNSLAYFSLSSRLCADKRYVESLFVGKKAEEVLVREKNYKRLLFLNVKMMHCLNSIHSYEDCYDIASMQLLTLQSFVNTDYEYNATVKNLAVCCLPLKKFDYIIEILENKEHVTMTELCCLLVALYCTNKEVYKQKFIEYKSMLNERDQIITDSLDKYLNYKDKKELNKLEAPNIMDNLVYEIKITEIN